MGRVAADVYPTHYRANARGDILAIAGRHGFRIEVLEYLNNGPTWFPRLPGLFELGRAYHWLLDRATPLEQLKCGIRLWLRAGGR